MVKVIDPRNIAQPTPARDPGLRVYNPGPAIERAVGGVVSALRRQEAKEKEVADKEQRVEDLRYLTEYEREHARQSEALAEEFRNREADADYVPEVNKRGAKLHSNVISSLGARYKPSEYARAQSERTGARSYTDLRIKARAAHNTAAVAQAVDTITQTMDETSLAVASVPDLEVLAGALESHEEHGKRLKEAGANPLGVDKLVREKREDATMNYFLGLLQDDNIDLAEEQLRSGHFDDDLGDGTTKSRLLNQIKTERDARERAAVSAFNAARTAATATALLGIAPDISEMKAAVSGMPRGTRGAANAQIEAVQSTANSYKRFGLLPEGSRASVLDDARARLYAPGVEVTEQQRKRFEALERLDAAASAQQREDATVLVVNAGLTPAIDPTVPVSIADPAYAGPAAEIANETTRRIGIGPNIQTLPRAAFDQVSEGLESTEESKRSAAYHFLSRLNSDTLTNVLESLGDDVRPGVRVAISIAPRDPDLAIKIGRGEHLRSQQGGTAGRIMPTDTELAGALELKLQGAFRHIPQRRQDVTQAALSLYALRATGDDYDENLFNDVLDKLIPGEMLLTVNEAAVLLPPDLAGLSEDQYKQGIAVAGGRPVDYEHYEAAAGSGLGIGLYTAPGTVSRDPEFPVAEFPERVGEAFDPITGAALQMDGYTMVEVIDADGRPLTNEEVRKLRLGRPVGPGVYVAETESSTGEDYAPVRVVYRSTDKKTEFHAGFAIDLNKVTNQSLPKGIMPERDNVPDDEEPMKPKEHLKHGTFLERFKKANDQFGKRVEMNHAQTMSNLGEVVDEPDDVTAAKDLLERLREHIAKTGKEDRKNPDYIALQDEVIEKFGSPEAFAQLLEQGGAIN